MFGRRPRPFRRLFDVMSTFNSGASGGLAPRHPGRINYHWLAEAWALFAAQAGVWIGATAMLLAVVAVGLVLLVGATFVLAAFAPASGSSRAILSSPAGWVWLVAVSVITLALLYGAWFITCGLHVMAVKQVRGEPIGFRDVFTGRSVFWRMVGFNVLFGFVFTVGTVLCVIPGLVLGGLLLPASSLVAEGESVSAAFSRSIDATKHDWLNATLLFIILQVILSLGMSLGIGFLVVMPLYWLVSALACRDLIGPVAPRHAESQAL